MRFYAISWTYGAHVTDSRTGERLGNYHAFGSKSERDAWVGDGDPYTTNPGARDAIQACDPELRRLLARPDLDYLIQPHEGEDAEADPLADEVEGMIRRAMENDPRLAGYEALTLEEFFARGGV